MPSANGRRSSEIRRRGRASAICLLLASAAAASTPATPTEARPAEEVGPLEQLAGTLGELKARLRAIRQDLTAMQAGAGARRVDLVPPDQRRPAPGATPDGTRAAPAIDFEALRARMAAERAAWQHAEAAMTGELTGLRERLAAADGALAQLRQDREALVRHITELDAQVQKARTRELVDALVETQRPTIEPAKAPPAAGLMRVTPSAFAAEPPPALAGARRDLVRAGSHLDLRAELALAQLRIAELTTALDSARLREQATEAEAASLRSLTEAQIKRFMGHE